MGGGDAGEADGKAAATIARAGRGGPAVPSPEALAAGYERLELALIEAATASLLGEAGAEGAPVVSADTAVKLLNLRRTSLAATAGADAPLADAEAMRATIAARVKAVRRARRRSGKKADEDRGDTVPE